MPDTKLSFPHSSNFFCSINLFANGKCYERVHRKRSDSRIHICDLASDLHSSLLTRLQKQCIALQRYCCNA